MTVYPRVVPLFKIDLPSRSPMGSLRTKQPIFEDPSRPSGKRDYSRGDSLRRIDWKSSAVVGRLQVKLFEPSIALETTIFLNLNAQEYYYKMRFNSAELAIVIAASLANWVSSKKQSVGLITNGIDPLCNDSQPQPLLPSKGREHLMHLLETLARVRSEDTLTFTSLIHKYRPSLSWGTTMIIITGLADEALFKELFQAQRSGMDLVLILCGEGTGYFEARQRARAFGIPAFILREEKDLESWRV
jgi:uncharacterized protein (DUF58 family)